MRTFGVFSLIAAAVVVVGCAVDNPVGLTDAAPVGGPANLGSCMWSPSGTVLIPSGDQQTFFPDQGGCTGYVITITPSTAPYGFTQGTDCNLKSVTISGSTLFKIRACDIGTGTVTIKLGGTTVQTISLDNAL